MQGNWSRLGWIDNPWKSGAAGCRTFSSAGVDNLYAEDINAINKLPGASHGYL